MGLVHMLLREEPRVMLKRYNFLKESKKEYQRVEQTNV